MVAFPGVELGLDAVYTPDAETLRREEEEAQAALVAAYGDRLAAAGDRIAYELETLRRARSMSLCLFLPPAAEGRWRRRPRNPTPL